MSSFAAIDGCTPNWSRYGKSPRLHSTPLEPTVQATGRRSLLGLVSMNQATEPVLPAAATPTAVYVVSTARSTLDEGGSVCVEARMGITSAIVATTTTARMPLPTTMRFISDS